MSELLNIAAGTVLLVLGLRLSAFFSGSETGFYRVSQLRLSIDADSGDANARRLVWFVRNPAYFVATTLVGNNVANYLTTLAIGLVAVAVAGASSGIVEIVATLLVSPVVFVFGELVPKNLYYRSPMSLLRAAAPWFTLFYWLFLPISLPLIAIAKSVERLSHAGDDRQLELLLGRNRLVQAISQGRETGLLWDVQAQLAHGVFDAASTTVRGGMTTLDRALDVDETKTCAEVLAHARQYGLNFVLLHAAGRKGDLVGYVRVVDVALAKPDSRPKPRPLPRVAASATRLEALATLRKADAARGLVVDGERPVGVVSQQGLVERLFRTPQVPRGVART